jgi:hypothetical protein
MATGREQGTAICEKIESPNNVERTPSGMYRYVQCVPVESICIYGMCIHTKILYKTKYIYTYIYF